MKLIGDGFWDMRPSWSWWECGIDWGVDTILDPDGWDRKNLVKSWNEFITRAEFEERLMESTVMIRRQEDES